MAANWAAKATSHMRSEQQLLLVQVMPGAGGVLLASGLAVTGQAADRCRKAAVWWLRGQRAMDKYFVEWR
jgi:hypothetical protein